MEHALLIDRENDVSVRVEGSHHAVALVIEDARRHTADSFYLRVGGVPVNFNAAIDWEVASA